MARGDYGWKSRAKRFAELLNADNKVAEIEAYIQTIAADPVE